MMCTHDTVYCIGIPMRVACLSTSSSTRPLSRSSLSAGGTATDRATCASGEGVGAVLTSNLLLRSTLFRVRACVRGRPAAAMRWCLVGSCSSPAAHFSISSRLKAERSNAGRRKRSINKCTLHATAFLFLRPHTRARVRVPLPPHQGRGVPTSGVGAVQ